MRTWFLFYHISSQVMSIAFLICSIKNERTATRTEIFLCLDTHCRSPVFCIGWSDFHLVVRSSCFKFYICIYTECIAKYFEILIKLKWAVIFLPLTIVYQLVTLYAQRAEYLFTQWFLIFLDQCYLMISLKQMMHLPSPDNQKKNKISSSILLYCHSWLDKETNKHRRHVFPRKCNNFVT